MVVVIKNVDPDSDNDLTEIAKDSDLGDPDLAINKTPTGIWSKI